MKLDNSVPRLENDSPPDKNADIPATRSAVVSKRTALANVLTPVITDSSTNFAPEINPDALFINSVKAVPISGRLEATPSINPPTILPKNEPIAFPIFSKIGIPTLRNSSNFGNSVTKAPMAAINPPIATTRATKAATPNKAAGPANPATSSNIHAADKASTSVDNAMAIPIDCSGSRSLMLFRIALSPHITNPITTTAANAIGDMALAKLRISIAPTSAISNTERATAEPIACSGFISLTLFKIALSPHITNPIITTAAIAIPDIALAKLRIFIAPTSAMSNTESANAEPMACSGLISLRVDILRERAITTIPMPMAEANALFDMSLASPRIFIAPTSAINKTDRARADPMAFSGSMSFIESKISLRTNNAAITISKGTNIPVEFSHLKPPIILIDADNDNSRIDKEPAAPKADAGSISESAQIIVASAATTAVNTTIVAMVLPKEPFSVFI